jgi:hypothetical protein
MELLVAFSGILGAFVVSNTQIGEIILITLRTMQSVVVIALCLIAATTAVNTVGNLELKEAFDAAFIRMLADGTYDTIVEDDTGDAPEFYYGDCAVPTTANMNITYPYVILLPRKVRFLAGR